MLGHHKLTQFHDYQLIYSNHPQKALGRFYHSVLEIQGNTQSIYLNRGTGYPLTSQGTKAVSLMVTSETMLPSIFRPDDLGGTLFVGSGEKEKRLKPFPCIHFQRNLLKNR